MKIKHTIKLQIKASLGPDVWEAFSEWMDAVEERLDDLELRLGAEETDGVQLESS